ncbi:MAG: lipoate--protein ligase [Clostridia bacterium]|nr:lipoate--protein ligase [Clostridia bacterium]
MNYRMLRGDSFNPFCNLAVEALLFETLGPEEIAFYLWQNQNTVVIGRHQNAWQECRVKLLEDEGGLLARRSTGGGAVYHDLGNLNFTFVAPRAHYDVRRQLDVIRRAAADFGIETAFTGRNDLVIAPDGAKFSGNAFKFSDAVGMHHGTVLVSVDMDKLGRYLVPGKDKLKAKGIESVRARVCNLAELNPDITVPALADALERAFEAAYGPAERLAVNDLDPDRLAALKEQFAAWDFRLGKALPFDATLSHRFDWGGVTLELALRHGVIERASVWSDAMDEAVIARIAPALEGLRYENAAIADALHGLKDPRMTDLAAWIALEELG